MQDIHHMLAGTRVIPVMAFTEVAPTLRIIENMIDAGLRVIELTMRSAVAIETLAAAKAEFGEAAHIGMGTIMTPDHLRATIDAGADFGVSPGLTPTLSAAITASGLPFLPGVATVSEAMAAQDSGFRFLKFFPAEQAGGAAYLKSIGAVLPDITFCPTGGVNPTNAQGYLALPNVGCVGTSGLTAMAAPGTYDRAEFQSKVAAHIPNTA